MLRLLLLLCCCGLFTVACDDQFFTFTRTTPLAQKPSVRIIPVIDSSDAHYDWNLSEELTTAIFSEITRRNHISLVYTPIKPLKNDANPFSQETAWIKQALPNDSFVVFLELMEHEELFDTGKKPTADLSSCGAHLNMSMRVRAFDLQGETPKVILQEIVHHSHYVPPPFTSKNFFQSSWEDATFNITPVGLSHAAFTKEIARRIDDYIVTMSKK